jgi:hypothetical protein
MIKEGIAALDMEAIKKKTLNLEDVTTWSALRFERTYSAPMNVLYKPSSSTKPSLQQSSPVYTPPDQSTIPANPKFSKVHRIHRVYLLSCIQG